MTDKFQNKYRISSARASWWDYGNDAAYFITICTRNREHYFGEIVNGEMQLSHVGMLADVMWHEIKNHAQHIELGEFVVMPNHIHGILILHGNENDNVNTPASKTAPVETRHALSLQIPQIPQSPQQIQSTESPQTPGQKRFQNQGKNTVSSIIGSYKSAVTKHAHRLGYEFGWQSRMWDNIIFTAESFVRISEYIQSNPRNWKDDKFYQENLP
jgi:putative transposase